MFQMTKRRSLLATFLFCALLFVACGDDDSSFVPDEFTDPIITPEEPTDPDSIVEPDSIAEPDTASTDSAKTDTTEKSPPELHLYILKDGVTSTNLYLPYPADPFLTKFEIGDIVTVAIVGYDTLEMPIVEYTNDVPIAWFFLSATKGSKELTLSIHNGSLADILGITAKDAPIEVVITMKEKGGFLFGLEMPGIQFMDYYIESYPKLSNDEFANFREIRSTGMGQKKLYRSSSPIDNCLGRNLYADSLAEEAGIATFINLTDSEDYAKTYADFDSSYYAKQDVIYLSLPVEFFSKPFKEGLVKAFRYMAEHEAPYLVHGIFGMDRTGFTIAILEALMGATTEDIQVDYAKTYTNYYVVIDGKQYTLGVDQVDFFKNVVVRNLRAVFHAEGINVPDTEDIDWATAAEQYLIKIGMTQEEISALKDKLK